MRPIGRRLIRVLSAPLALVALAVGCGTESDGPRRLSVEEILAAPAEPSEELVTAGRALPIGDFGFVLAGRDRSILVAVPPRRARRLALGQRIEVLGEVGRLTQAESIEVANAFQRDRDLRSDYRRLAAVVAPSTAGAPILRLEGFVGPGSPPLARR